MKLNLEIYAIWKRFGQLLPDSDFDGTNKINIFFIR